MESQKSIVCVAYTYIMHGNICYLLWWWLLYLENKVKNNKCTFFCKKNTEKHWQHSYFFKTKKYMKEILTIEGQNFFW